MENIKLNKTVFKKEQFDDTINKNFNQLKSLQDISFFDVNLATIDNFFFLYDKFFYEIPKTGDLFSHIYLIKKSSDYTNYKYDNEEVQSLLDEIASLREENLELRKSLINNT